MKKCPTCNVNFPDDDVFCPNDGTALVVYEGGDRFVFPLDEVHSVAGVPTQYIPVSSPKPPPSANPNWVYVLTGAFAAVVIMGGIFVFLSSERNGERAKQNDSRSGSTASAESVNREAANAMNAAANAANAAAALWAANEAQTAANAAPPSNISPRIRALGRQFNATFSGTVGGNFAEINLRRNGTEIGGKVRSRGSSADIFVDGYIDDDGEFRMEEKSDIGVVTGVYTGRLTPDGVISGSWTKPYGGKSHSIYLRRK